MALNPLAGQGGCKPEPDLTELEPKSLKKAEFSHCPRGLVHPSGFRLFVHSQPPPGKFISSSLPLEIDHKQPSVSRVRLLRQSPTASRTALLLSHLCEG